MQWKEYIPDGLRSYVRWLRTKHRYPGLKVAQSASVSPSCRFDSHVAIGANVRITDSSVGAYTYFGSDCAVLCADVGRFCSVAAGVVLGGGVHPSRDWVSTSPMFFSTANQCGTSFTGESRFEECRKVVVGNDVWIGSRSVVLPGLVIGDGALIGAGAVVTKNVEPYSVVAGVPARHLRYRFANIDREWLLKSKWWEWQPDLIARSASVFSNVQRLRESVEQLSLER